MRTSRKPATPKPVVFPDAPITETNLAGEGLKALQDEIRKNPRPLPPMPEFPTTEAKLDWLRKGLQRP